MNNSSEDSKEDSEKVLGPGKQLSRAREQQNLTRQQVAERLRLRVSSIQSIEEDRAEAGVSITFTKGYVRLYAKLLGLDAIPLLASFDTLHAENKQPARLQSFSRRVAREANDFRWNLVTYIIVFLVLGSVVLWWIDQSNFSLSSSFTDTNESSVLEQVSESIPVFESSELESQNTALNSAEQTTSDDMADDTLNQDDSSSQEDLQTNLQNGPMEILEEEVRAQAPVTIPSETAAELPSASSETAEVQEIIADTTLIDDMPKALVTGDPVDMVFTFSEDCWVSVKDANGETIAIGTKVKGRVMEVSGIPPIEVILGAPGAVELNFGGAQIDMSRFPVTRTANFQLPLQGE